MKSWPLLLLVLLAACQPDFTEQWEVTKPRLMVAKLLIDGDTENRTRPRPGETFSIRYFMMSPGKPQKSYDVNVATCVGTVLTDGTLACYDNQRLDALAAQIEKEFGIDVDFDLELDLRYEIDPYRGDDQLWLRGLSVPSLIEELPPPFDTLDRIATFGTFCVDGSVERVPGKTAEDPISELFQCIDNEDAKYQTPLPFTMSIFLDRGLPGHLNHHPSFECDESVPGGACNEGTSLYDQSVPGAFVLERPEKVAAEDGRERVLAWPAWDTSEPLPWDSCADAPESLPKVRAESGEYKVHMRFDASDRELYERQIEENGKPIVELQREELIVSHTITTHGGELNSYAQAVERELSDDAAVIDFDYTPPRQADEEDSGHIEAGGRLVRLYFSLRDQRSGVDFTTRELCLLPPED